MSATRFASKVAIVTAAGAGIGRAIALAWAKDGGAVVIVDKDKAAAERTGQEVA
ncbi:MAG: SDR family NAD(P)-dependent oxidoreductase, partial [Burkholderiales bacterium]|nr:SDR family NAD(P)-dependent oxidoreductase [Burkholderiales bacterium]